MIRRPKLPLTAVATAALAFGSAGLAGAQDVTVSHGYSNFGTLKYGPGEPFSYVNLDAPKGGEISLHALGNYDSFNLYTRNGNVATGTTVLYEDLFIAAADDPYAVYCYLCTTIEYPEDLSFVTVNLREDVTFADGSPMTAEDLKFTVDIFLEQGLPEFRNVVEGYFKSIEQTGPYQVRFEFNEAAPKRDRVGIVGIWNPFSKAWFEETGARIDESTLVPFMGTGPYIVGDFDVGRSLTYTRNPNWWGADLPINQGRHNFDSIRYEYFGDNTAALQAFFAGEYTMRIETSSKEWATAYDVPAVTRGDVIKATLEDGNISSAQGFVFNLKNGKWDDPRVRDAVRMMFNFEWSNETLFYGLYTRPTSFWGGSEMEAKGVPGVDETALLAPLVEEGLLDASILTDEAVLPPANTAASNQPDRRSRRAALRLMAEAGWETGNDGMLRNAAGETMELVIIQFNPTYDRIVNPFVENLRAIGVDARLERIDRAQYIERRRSGDWDLTNQVLGQGFEPGTGLKQWFGSETAADSSRNIMGLADPAVDRLVDLVIQAEDLPTLHGRTRALDRVLRAQGFWIPQWGNAEHWVAYWDMYRHPEEIPPLAPGMIDFWWQDAEAAAALEASGAL
ncbi:ABC transporter substrate-binding protein [Jannaschia pagri]|uniref:ABC transporter substrate-binding protein n=1 Tax=Jannaschia pagri TaxID=2829797 RepID=A0ABQ4NI97_9RHOB|nr:MULTISPECIES: extracellular solute-binding protein [unclassified Jannaschia]GIT89765.1 ABC transporter substrate-binding protein [Jannaschia sp. AI_61]GIT94127.1 ABC transporter substrate-binding protein [Jannaschia sp. AI_62]